MKLSDFVIDFLAARNIKKCFVVSGGAVIHLIDSCRKHPNIDYICSQHEQHGAASADMYARVTRHFGLMMTTSGPGATNLLTSVCNAYFDSIPLICITGQVARARLRKTTKLRQRGFQETDIESIFKSVTKYVKLIIDPLMIKYELEKALYFAKEGRQGPVILDIPDDLQRVDIDVKKLCSFIPPLKCNNFSINHIQKMFQLIDNASRPVVILGAGVIVSNTEKEAYEFIQKLKIPALTTWAAKGVFSFDDELNMGCFGICGPRYGNLAVQKADLIIVIGSKLSQMNTGGKQNLFAPNAKKIMVDIDIEEIDKFEKETVIIDLSINADLKEFFQICKNNFDIETKNQFTSWINEINNWKNRFPIIDDEIQNNLTEVNPYLFIKKLSKTSLVSDIVITDTGANLCWTGQAFDMKRGQKIFSAWNHTPMGYSLPASIGAAFASNNRVLCIIGDGGFMMCLQELATLRRHNLPVCVFLFNNKGHGIQKQTLENWLESNFAAVNETTGLYFPDYKKIAEAFKLEYVFIRDDLEIESKLNLIFEKKGPVFCEVNIFENQKILPMLRFGNGLEDLDTKLSQEEIQEILNVKQIYEYSNKEEN